MDQQNIYNQVVVFTDGAAKNQNKKDKPTLSSIGIIMQYKPNISLDNPNNQQTGDKSAINKILLQPVSYTKSISYYFKECIFLLENNPQYISQYSNQFVFQINEKETNQRAELMAIVIALLENINVQSLILYSDSLYSVKIINEWYHNWEQKGLVKENWDIIQLLMYLVKKRQSSQQQSEFIHIRGHQKIKDTDPVKQQQILGNDTADKLANKAYERCINMSFDIVNNQQSDFQITN